MKKSIKITIGVILLLVIAYFSLPEYAQRALIYQKAGIDDYTLFENRTIKSGQAQPWQKAKVASQLKINSEALAEFDDYQTIAYLIIKDNKIIFEKYWDGYGPESLTNSFSMAKSIVSLLIGAAIDDGVIKNINQPVSDFIDEYKTDENAKLTIKDVITMSSGLNWDESYGSLFSTTTDAYYGTNIKRLIYSLKVIETPGKKFKYLSGNPQLLAMVLEKATGKTISEYASKKFWKPMGAEHDALWCLDKKDGVEKAYCCFNSNARDFARWGQLVLNNGVWNNDTLVSPQYVKNAVTPALYLTDETGNNIDYYGYQWWIINIGDDKIPYMRGILGQYVFVIPYENAVVVRLGRKRSKNYTNHHPDDTYLYLRTAKTIIAKYKKLIEIP
jgi:CubicO group peptidase (beta-lactamase class C family)